MAGSPPCASASTSPTPASPPRPRRRESSSSSRARHASGGAEVVTRSRARRGRRRARARCDGDGRRVALERRRVVYAVNKPEGVVSTASDPQGRPTVVELIEHPSERLYPVGRLDVDTTGLILLTNDGELANPLTHPRYGVPKTYRVTVRRPPVTRAGAAQAARGRATSTTARRARRACASSRPTASRSCCARAASGRCGGWRGGRLPRRELERVALGPLRLGAPAPGGTGVLKHPEVEALRKLTSGRAHAGAHDARFAPCGSTPCAAPTTVAADDASDPRRHRRADARAARAQRAGRGDLVSCLFTLTPDLDAEFPAVAAREMGLARVPLHVRAGARRPRRDAARDPRDGPLLRRRRHSPSTSTSGEARALRLDLEGAQ